MTKRYSEDLNIWWEPTEVDKYVIAVGFTQKYINEVIDEAWHILPSQGKVKKGETLMCIESNIGFIKVPSPFTGTVMDFTDLARNFPEKITEDTPVCFFREGSTEEVIWPPVSPENLMIQNNLPRIRREEVNNIGLVDAPDRRGLRDVRPLNIILDEAVQQVGNF